MEKPRDSHSISMRTVFDFGTEHYNPAGVSVREYVFHPATLAIVEAYGTEALQRLVPQKGFDEFIPAIQTYIDRMKLSMPDKTDYLEHIKNAEIVVDLGCADGAMLKYLRAQNPHRTYIGYDISEPMLALARKDGEGIAFTNDWNRVLDLIKEAKGTHKGKSVLVLSSIIHEIYAYLPPEGQKAFWDKVWDSGFDYIAIRDMMVSSKTDRPADPAMVQKIRANYDKDKLEQWERRWGPLEQNRSLVHFLLTSPYKENWNRELNEDYLPFTLESFLNHIPEDYKLKYLDHHRHHYTVDRVRREFDGAELTDNTHVKMIIARREQSDRLQGIP